MNDIISLRHKLHKYPEISNNEFNTIKIIDEFLDLYKPDNIIKLSNTGRAYIFNGLNEGKTLMFRAELDALPINELTDVEYKSVNNAISHSCGHDGHMAILAGLAKFISINRPKKGRVILLFQPAEEVEQGAKDVVNDVNFKQIEPDYIFALHNIPAEDKHKVIIKEGSFASASKGMTIKLFGKSSHAAEPEKGISPVNAIAEIITKVHSLRESKSLFKNLILLTIINIKLGEVSFGTSPGYAEIRITLRAYENNDMTLLSEQVEDIISKVSIAQKLKYEIEYSEVFPATINNSECVAYIKEAAEINNLKLEYKENPFKWSEDFGYYTELYKGGFLGLGAGINQPALHNPDYDFPDDIIKTGVNIFSSIYKKICL